MADGLSISGGAGSVAAALDDLVAATRPRLMRLTAKFYVRGGVFTNVVAEHRQAGWQPAPRVDLSSFDSESNTRG